MLKTKIKICGLTRLCDIKAVNEYKPNYIGFVFAESKRRVTPEQAAALRERLNHGIIPVGVFVNEEPQIILDLVQKKTIEMIQLHGDESEEYISKIKSLTGKPVIKAGYSEAADYLLFDSPEPGSGKTFNWDTIGKVKKPFFLAGGLNIENVAEAILTLNPFAVDVSSGVETNGIKDPEKIKEFIRRVRDE